MYPGQQWIAQQQDETLALKYKQIDSLRQFFPTLKELTREVLYEVPVTLPSRKVVTLRISLAREFPKVPPVLQVFPSSQHKLLDVNSYVIPQAHENLLRWSIHASLGKTVYEIIQKFVQEPPVILQLPQPTNVAPQPNVGMPNPNMIPQHQPPIMQNNMPSVNKTHTPLPVVPANFPELDSKSVSELGVLNSTPSSELDSKSVSELGVLLSDDLEFNKFFESLPQIQTMKKVRDDLRNNNQELAKKNLAFEAEIENLKREITTRHQQVIDKRNSYDQKIQRQQEVLKRFSTQSLIDQLGVAASEAEAESDNIAKEFLAGSIDQKTFIKDFVEKRKLFHLRAAKKESLLMLAR